VAEWLSIRYKALSSNSGTARERERKKESKRERERETVTQRDRHGLEWKSCLAIWAAPHGESMIYRSPKVQHL
jgi:hypothetical protein